MNSPSNLISSSISRWVRAGTDAPVVNAPEIETDEELARRNAERLAAAKTALGQRYLLHPSNRVRRDIESHSVESQSQVVILRSVAALPTAEERVV